MENLYKNIKVLCKAKNVKITEIEKGYQPGYISRAAKRGCDKLPISMVYRASKLFGVSIDDLIEKDFAKALRADEIQTEIERLQKELKELTGA